MMAIKRPGILRVVQMHGRHEIRHDFDAEEWGYEWIKREDGLVILRLLHDGDPEVADSFEFVEFSTPATIEFEPE